MRASRAHSRHPSNAKNESIPRQRFTNVIDRGTSSPWNAAQAWPRCQRLFHPSITPGRSANGPRLLLAVLEAVHGSRESLVDRDQPVSDLGRVRGTLADLAQAADRDRHDENRPMIVKLVRKRSPLLWRRAGNQNSPCWRGIP